MKEHEKNNEKVLVNSTREAFLTKPLGSLMLKNILPAVISMLFMALYNVMDGVIVGRRLGPEALASVNMIFPILAVLQSVAIMIAIGGNAKVAVLLGKGETDKAGSILSFIILLGTIVGIGASTIVHLTLPHILRFFGTSGSLVYYGGEYLNTLYLFFTLMIVLFILEQAVRNDGKPNMAAGVMVFVATLNIFLNYLFLFPLNMGIGGAALATGISQSLGAIYFLGYFINKTVNKIPGLRFTGMKGSWKEVPSITMNGSSEMFNSLALGITTFLFNRLIINYVGPMGVAAFTLVQYIMFFGITIFMAMGNGIQPIISYNHGAGLCERVTGILKRLMVSSLMIATTIFIIMRWQAAKLIGIFIPNHPEALRLSLEVANYFSWSLLFMPFGVIGSIYFTALEEPSKSLIVAVSRGLIFTLIGLGIFPLLWGEIGIWITPVFAEVSTSIVALSLMYRWMKKPGELIV